MVNTHNMVVGSECKIAVGNFMVALESPVLIVDMISIVELDSKKNMR